MVARRNIFSYLFMLGTLLGLRLFAVAKIPLRLRAYPSFMPLPLIVAARCRLSCSKSNSKIGPGKISGRSYFRFLCLKKAFEILPIRLGKDSTFQDGLMEIRRCLKSTIDVLCLEGNTQHSKFCRFYCFCGIFCQKTYRLSHKVKISP